MGRTRISICVVMVVVGFMGYCATTPSTVFGDFVLVEEVKSQTTVGTSGSGSGTSGVPGGPVGAFSTLTNVATGNTSSADAQASWGKSWQWQGSTIYGAHIDDRYESTVTLSGSVSAAAQSGEAGSSGSTTKLTLSNACNFPGCSYNLPITRITTERFNIPGPINNGQIVDKTLMLRANTAAAVSVTGGTGSAAGTADEKITLFEIASG